MRLEDRYKEEGTAVNRRQRKNIRNTGTETTDTDHESLRIIKNY